MTASDHVNYTQLSMFMTARELREGTSGVVPLPGDVRAVQKAIGRRAEANDRFGIPPTGSHLANITSMAEPEEAMWADKLHASKRGTPDAPSLHSRIEAEQVTEPIRLHLAGTNEEGDKAQPDMSIANGHHRIAASYDINPDRLLPVRYTSHSRAGEWNTEMEGIHQADKAKWAGLLAEVDAHKAKKAAEKE